MYIYTYEESIEKDSSESDSDSEEDEVYSIYMMFILDKK
jgi:hypothetical protein